MNSMQFIVLYFLTLSGLSESQPQCICVQKIADGCIRPTVIRSTADGSGRLYVGDILGTIWIVEGTERLPRPLLDLTYRDEAGFTLLSMQFHPDYEQNGRLFLQYHYMDSDAADATIYQIVSEFRRNDFDHDLIDPESERVILTLARTRSSHNEGDILFGSDGYLYASHGDGAQDGTGDPMNNAQNLTSRLGSVVRIDVNSGDDPYGIPPDNPYLDNPEALPELFAKGLRNPWRMSVDPGDPETGYGEGRIFIGDVGQARWEEIDILEPGGNYGWAGREGPECYREELCGNTEPEVFPTAYYHHNETGGRGCVISGFMYRGCEFPDFQGWFFFGDFMDGSLWPDNWDWQKLSICGPEVCTGDLTDTYDNWIFTFGTDEYGEQYFSTGDEAYGNNPTGVVYKLVDPNNWQVCNGKSSG